METEGHQIDLSRGRNEVTVTVTADNPNVTETYVLRVNRGYSEVRRWKAVEDFDTLITAGNTDPGASGPTRRRCGWPTLPTTTSSTPTRCPPKPATATRTSTSTPTTANPSASGPTGRRCGWPTGRRQALRLHPVHRGPRQRQGMGPRLRQRQRLGTSGPTGRRCGWLDRPDAKRPTPTRCPTETATKTRTSTSRGQPRPYGLWSDGDDDVGGRGRLAQTRPV